MFRCVAATVVAGTLMVGTALGQGIAQPSIMRSALAVPKEALKVNDQIYQATGFGNTYLVVTKEGNVVIDTSTSAFVAAHKRILRAANDGPVKYIIVTHAHPDHVGGVGRWREKETKVIAHANYPKFRDYQRRLSGLSERRNSAQYGIPKMLVARSAQEYLSAPFEADVTFEKSHEFKLGELTFQLFYTPGETQDQISVWIPELKAAFIGDNMYETFPNIYTLRGTEFRSPIDWMASLERVMAWEPEILLGSHLLPIQGKETIRARLTQYRDAIKHVHDETVKGMNEGKNVYELMTSIKLPTELAMGEQYGKLSWSIRGIYEGYVGWFDERPVDMYAPGPASVHQDLVELAGGVEKVVERGSARVKEGRLVEALHLFEIALNVAPTNETGLRERINVYKALLERTENVIEQGWLREGIRRDEAALKGSEGKSTN